MPGPSVVSIAVLVAVHESGYATDPHRPAVVHPVSERPTQDLCGTRMTSMQRKLSEIPATHISVRVSVGMIETCQILVLSVQGARGDPMLQAKF